MIRGGVVYDKCEWLVCVCQCVAVWRAAASPEDMVCVLVRGGLEGGISLWTHATCTRVLGCYNV
jgi:hypothetical protein